VVVVAVDTADKRRSFIAMTTDLLPIPDNASTVGDRYTRLKLYSRDFVETGGGVAGHLFLGDPFLSWVFGIPTRNISQGSVTNNTVAGLPGTSWTIGRPETR
jgi:hypothetical protein